MIRGGGLRNLRRIGRRLPEPVKRVLRRVIAPEPPAPASRIRRFDLALPRPPTDDRPARSLRIEAPWKLYVPRLLEERGFARYEPEAMAVYLAAIERHRGRTAYDVGANVGVFSLLASAVTDAEVVGFEPTPDLAAAFRSVVARNQLDCVVEEIALGATTGRATLHLSDTTDSSNSLRSGFRPGERVVDVALETLDGYVERTGRVPGALKIDTESTEPDVLRGALETLRTARPWIVCEVLAGRTEAELMGILRPLGYLWYPLTGEIPAVASDEIRGDPTYQHMDWLFVPEEPDEAFWASTRAWRAELDATDRR